MVVFRLTQEEYTSLRDACRSKGGRNMSEFTRSELLAMLRKEPIAVLMQERFLEIEQKLVQLEVAVAQVTRILATRTQEMD
jgi:hypothetical protein